MALKRDTRYPGRFTAGNAAHPQGAFKNRTAPDAKDGSYLEQDWANDWDGFFARLLTVAGVSPNGNVDSGTSSQYYDALTAVTQGRLSSVKILSGAGSYTPDEGVKKIKVTVIGAGGGSGGLPATNSSQYAASGGGAGGSSAVSMINTSSLSFPLSYSVGVGGTAGAGSPVTNPGGNGGNTTFGNITAPGGSGSTFGAVVSQGSTAITGNASPGAVATGGNIVNMRGSAGGYAFLFSANTISGSGGDSLMGTGGFGVGFPVVRNQGTGYGSGGSGVASNISTPATAGTPGTNGVIIVEEYF